MQLLFQFLLLCLGLVSLWKSGKLAVRNAIGLSVIYGIETFTIGFFLFSLSTGLPEISSAVVSSLTGVPELSVGDLLGTSLVNTSLILGITLILARTVQTDPSARKKLLRTIALIAIIFTGITFAPRENFFAGVLLIILYLGSFFWFQVGIPKGVATKEIHQVEKKIETIERKVKISPKLDILFKLFTSLLFLMLSSWLTVYAAKHIASSLHIELNVIGATFLAVGTSLPELTLEVHAVKAKENSLALGNIFGSTLLNISLTLGILILMNPRIDLSFARNVLPFLLFVIFWVVFRILRRKTLTLKDGILLLIVFGSYVGWIAFTTLQKSVSN